MSLNNKSFTAGFLILLFCASYLMGMTTEAIEPLFDGLVEVPHQRNCLKRGHEDILDDIDCDEVYSDSANRGESDEFFECEEIRDEQESVSFDREQKRTRNDKKHRSLACGACQFKCYQSRDLRNHFIRNHDNLAGFKNFICTKIKNRRIPQGYCCPWNNCSERFFGEKLFCAILQHISKVHLFKLHQEYNNSKQIQLPVLKPLIKDLQVKSLTSAKVPTP